MVRLIPKRKVGELFKVRKWKLVFGRRKTGKTFFVKNFVEWDKYYFVHRSREITEIKEGYKIRYEELKREIKERRDIRIVIDEFHRLPEEFPDFLHSLAGKGADLILITSSLHFAKDILGKRSPLLGLVFPIEFRILSPLEVLNLMKEHLKGRELIERSIFLREVSLLDFALEDDFWDILIRQMKYFVPSLIGEIFREEDRKVTSLYEGILYAIGLGKLTSLEISTYLYSLGLIKRNDPSIISMHLRNLETMGIIRKIRVLGKRKKYHYFIDSPLIDIFYYIDGKYGIDFGSKKVLMEKIPMLTEIFFTDLFSEIYGMTPVKISRPDLEIDIALLEFQRLKIVGEVKWVKDLDKRDLMNIERKLGKFRDCKKFLIIPEKGILPYEPKGIEVMDIEDILKTLEGKTV